MQDYSVGVVIVTLVGLVMVVIGVCQWIKRDEPVGFYNLTSPPRKEDITDVSEWNKKHGVIWILYGLCIELGFWTGYFVRESALEVLFMLGGVLIPLPFMVMRHKRLEKRYIR